MHSLSVDGSDETPSRSPGAEPDARAAHAVLSGGQQAFVSWLSSVMGKAGGFSSFLLDLLVSSVLFLACLPVFSGAPFFPVLPEVRALAGE